MSLPHLGDHREGDLVHGLSAGIVVSYARPFKEGEGMGTLPASFEEFEIPRFRKNHDILIDSRDKIYGHKDEQWESHNLGEEKKYYLTLTKDLQYRTSASGRFIDAFDLFLELLHFQRARLREESDSLIGVMLENKIKYEGFKPGEYEIISESPYFIPRTDSD
jgi:hypothetical protein